MKNSIFDTPSGTKDLIFEEAISEQKIESKLLSMFYKLGYKPVSTPTLEYFSTFNNGIKEIPEESIFKFSGSNGKTLALRADNTSPILRVAMSKLRNIEMPMLLCYSQEVYRNTLAHKAKPSQMLQGGIEIIGGETLEEDVRCIFTALEALKKCSPSAKLEIGHALFFDAIMEKYQLSDSEKNDLKSYISARNSGEYPFSTAMSNSDVVDIAMKIQKLFGTSEILSKAEILADGNETALKVLNYIKNIVKVFTDAGYGDMLIIDLGIVQSMDYYTGIVFKGYIDGVGEAVLSGGRYDNLLSTFNSSLSACGFGLNISAVAELDKSKLPDVTPASFKDGVNDIIKLKNKLNCKEEYDA